MRVETFPYLSALTFLPMLGALVIFFIPRITQGAARSIALLTALGSLLVSLVVLFRFDPQAPFEAGVTVPFQERIDWGREVGASYFLGVDGIAVLLIVLTTLISIPSIRGSASITSPSCCSRPGCWGSSSPSTCSSSISSGS
jgi:NADH-quinone oxidoreductase subunit M